MAANSFGLIDTASAHMKHMRHGSMAHIEWIDRLSWASGEAILKPIQLGSIPSLSVR